MNSNVPIEPRGHSAIRIVALFLVLAGVVGVVAAMSVNSSGSTRASEPTLREFTLVAEEVDWEIQPGITVKAWTYNGTMPGPEIRVNEGDTVRVTLINKLPVGTTLHWHGVDVPNNMDGPAGLNQAPVEPGETFVYEFTASPAGTRWYHSHTNVNKQIKMGLYGSFIVEPAEAQVEFDREYTMVLAEWDLELTPDVAAGLAPPGPRDQTLRGGELGTDLFLMNGHIFDAIPPIEVKEGERLLIRIINAGDIPHPIHTHGHSFKIVATDGNPVPESAQLTKDTVLVAPGERYDLLIEANNNGVWMVHCHIENHAENGMMTVLQYEDAIPPGPAGEGWQPGTGSDSHAGMDHTASPVTGTPVALATPGASPTAFASAPSESGAVVKTSDNRFIPREVTIKVGATVTWQNIGSNVHSLVSRNGAFPGRAMGSGTSYNVTFTEPGVYKYFCRQHYRQGMSGTIIVTE